MAAHVSASALHTHREALDTEPIGKHTANDGTDEPHRAVDDSIDVDQAIRIPFVENCFLQVCAAVDG